MRREEYYEVNGCKIYVEILGSGYPLFILHGGPGLDLNIFGDYLDSLSETFELIYVDQRGQGKSSDVSEETITTKQSAADIVKLAEILNHEKYAIMGHSYGAFVALEHAVNFPGDAEYIILLNTIDSVKRMKEYQNKPLDLPDALIKAQQNYMNQLQKSETPEDANEALGALLPFYFNYPTDFDLIEDFKIRTIKLQFRPDILYSETGQKYGNFDLLGKLDTIASNVLIVSGDNDYICRPYVSKEMNVEIKGSKLIVYEQTGHMSYVERNKEILYEIRSFISK